MARLCKRVEEVSMEGQKDERRDLNETDGKDR
jgi:hypothetical protein